MLRPEQLRLARKLQWIHSVAAGVSQLMYPEFANRASSITNASGVHAIPMAEHVIGMILALLRDFPGAMRYQTATSLGAAGNLGGTARPRELHGQTAVLVGFGAVGRAVAERLRALGVRVWAVTRSGKADPALAERVLAPPGRPAVAGRRLDELGGGHASRASRGGRRSTSSRSTAPPTR